MKMLGTIVEALNIVQITLTAPSLIVKGEHDADDAVHPFPVCIRDISTSFLSGTTINFQNCNFTDIQAKELGECIPKHVILKLDKSALPLDANGRNIFFGAISNRTEPVGLIFFGRQPEVGKDTYQLAHRREAALKHLKTIADNGLISFLQLDSQSVVYSLEELAAYKELQVVIGGNLEAPVHLEVMTRSDGRKNVSIYHSRDELPAWKPAFLEKQKRECKTCVMAAASCYIHKSKANEILVSLGLNMEVRHCCSSAFFLCIPKETSITYNVLDL